MFSWLDDNIDVFIGWMIVFSLIFGTIIWLDYKIDVIILLDDNFVIQTVTFILYRNTLDMPLNHFMYLKLAPG
jgi:hypothetical protein